MWKFWNYKRPCLLAIRNFPHIKKYFTVVFVSSVLISFKSEWLREDRYCIRRIKIHLYFYSFIFVFSVLFSCVLTDSFLSNILRLIIIRLDCPGFSVFIILWVRYQKPKNNQFFKKLLEQKKSEIWETFRTKRPAWFLLK